MANRLASGQARRAARLKECASDAVKVSAGSLSVEVQATKGRTDFKVDNGMGGFTIVTSDRDYLVTAADLIFAGVVKRPERGWQVRETVGGLVEIYECLPIAKGLPVWQWADEFRVLLRIHTKFVGTEL
jgi:hypothetical protein